MPAIMSLEERRPRGTVLGERADRRRVSEAENFSDATFAAISTHGISFGLRTTRANCRTPRAIKLNSADRSSACVLGACELGRCNVSRLIAPTHGDAALMKPATLLHLITNRIWAGGSS
jgi:hypothetical protein